MPLKAHSKIPKTQVQQTAAIEKAYSNGNSVAGMMRDCKMLNASIFGAAMGAAPYGSTGVGTASGLMAGLSGYGFGYGCGNGGGCQQQETEEVSFKTMTKNALLNGWGNLLSAFGLGGSTSTQSGNKTGISSFFRFG